MKQIVVSRPRQYTISNQPNQNRAFPLQITIDLIQKKNKKSNPQQKKNQNSASLIMQAELKPYHSIIIQNKTLITLHKSKLYAYMR